VNADVAKFNNQWRLHAPVKTGEML
jgi:hypothetical protein